MSKITYEDKETLNAQPSIANKNKVSSDDMNEIKTVVNTNDDTLTLQETLITNITGTILWTNPNPTIAMAPTQITLSSSDYDILEIFYVNYTTDGKIISGRTIKGNPTILITLFFYNSNMYMGERIIEYIDATTLNIGNCRKIIDNSSISNPDVSNSWAIPLYIVGYKTGLFN